MKINCKDFCESPQLVYEGNSKDEAKEYILSTIEKEFHGISADQIQYMKDHFDFIPYLQWTLECCYLQSWKSTTRKEIHITNYLKYIIIEGDFE